ncbi:MAG TPA: diguanylate cyclase [Phycisphaerae bacterium]|nr:diguanylate cyclase [Phycisphaerae bacterium]
MDLLVNPPVIDANGEPFAPEAVFYRNLLNRITDGAYFVDRHRRITFWNHAAERLTGYRADEVVGTCCADNLLVHADDAGNCLCEGSCPLSATLEDGTPRCAKVYLKHRLGHRVAVRVHTIPWARDGRIVGAVEIFQCDAEDVQERDRLGDIAMLPLLDVLTGIGNRQYLQSSLAAAIAELPEPEAQCGVILLHLDSLASWNAALGLEVGDRALQVVAQTLVGVSGPFVAAGRWGSGNFMAIVAHCRSDELTELAARYQALVAASQVVVGEKALAPRVSVTTLTSEPHESVAHFIERIEMALGAEPFWLQISPAPRL